MTLDFEEILIDGVPRQRILAELTHQRRMRHPLYARLYDEASEWMLKHSNNANGPGYHHSFLFERREARITGRRRDDATGKYVVIPYPLPELVEWLNEWLQWQSPVNGPLMYGPRMEYIQKRNSANHERPI